MLAASWCFYISWVLRTSYCLLPVFAVVSLLLVLHTMEVFQFLDNRTFDLDKIFTKQKTNHRGDIENGFRKIGHLIEKKINAWWDMATHEKYIKDKLVPRRLRWDVPINDGLVDKESTDEWFHFFNDKGLELLDFLKKESRRRFDYWIKPLK